MNGGRNIPPVSSEAHVSLADLDRIATQAADRAAAQVKNQALSRDDVEEMVDRAIERFLLRVGVEADDLPNLRKDFTALRAMRETREALVRHGLTSLVGMLMLGIGTAIVLYFKGAR